METTNKTKTITCKVCGFEFFPDLTRHYIARDPGKTGFAAAFQSNDEEEQFDAYDCPSCGSQVIAQVHKRKAPMELDDDAKLECMGHESIAKFLGISAEAVNILHEAAKDNRPILVLNNAAEEAKITHHSTWSIQVTVDEHSV